MLITGQPAAGAPDNTEDRYAHRCPRCRVAPLMVFRVSHGPRFFVMHIALPLVLGGLIYLSWRSPSLLMFQWANSLRLDGAVAALRTGAAPFEASVPGWVQNSVPDGLWVYAYTAFLGRIWRDRSPWLALPAALALGGELGQAVGLVPGVFDVVDVLLMSVAAGAALFASFRGSPS